MELSEMNAAFLDELEEQLETMEHGILDLEGTPENDEAIQDLFRVAHTIKGSAAVMEFETMKVLTHHMEYVLDEVRGHRLSVDRPMIDLLFESLDKLRTLKELFANGNDINMDVSPLINQLEMLLNAGEAEPAAEKPLLGQRANQRGEITELVQLKIEEFAESGHSIYRVEVAFTEDVLLKLARAKLVSNALDSIGDLLHSIPDADTADIEDDEWDNFVTWIATKEDAEVVQRIAENCSEVKQVTVQEWTQDKTYQTLSTDLVSQVETLSNEVSVDSGPIVDRHQEESKDDREGKNSPQRSAAAQPQTIRVDVQRLESLMNLVGELVIDRTRVEQIGSALNRKHASEVEIKDLESVSGHMARIVSDLQENVMMARMLPIERVFNRFPRMVRSLASQLGKDIELVIEGKETQLDRTLIDEIADPLIHLIRNAIDHGLEMPDERKSKGKPVKGKLSISAGHQENHIVIRVEDDGVGIHPEKIRQSAMKKGIITKSEAEELSDYESQNLIFSPGFSTATEVTDISGRGVGMDIVRANIEKLEGMIEISSTPDVGTRFEVKLPLTLAIIRGLLVEVNQQTFVVPITSVAEIIRVKPDSIQYVNGRAVLWVREQTLPIRWLHDEFGIAHSQSKKRNLSIVVIGIGHQKVGFVVDELKGNQEIVKKSLGGYIGTLPGLSGCTILGDGNVAMILDVTELMKRK